MLVIMLTLVFFLYLAVFNISDIVNASSLVKRELPVYSVETSEKRISISFDCAWGVDSTDKLLEEMKKYGVRCTFFAVEFWSEKYHDYLKKIDEQGHEIGTHSATHSHMSKMNEADIEKELVSSSKAVEDVIGKKVTLFRAPFGEYNDRLILTSRKLGYQVIQWDVDSLDWKNISALEISTRVLQKVKNGSIILCHNNGLHTAEALPLIFSALKERGFEFVPIGELIYKDNYQIDTNGRQKTVS